jgi:hemerythrin-like domain-containing protein
MDEETPSTVTSYLTADHRRLDKTLDEAVRLAQASDRAAAPEQFRLFQLGLDRHIEIEERLFFPAFEQRSGMTTGPTMVMRSEHAEIRQGVERIGAHLSAGDLAAALATMTQLAALLGRHDAKEERVLYPMSDRLVALDLPELLRRMS